MHIYVYICIYVENNYIDAYIWVIYIYIYICTCIYKYTISKFQELKKWGTELKHWVCVSQWAWSGWGLGFRKDFVTRWCSQTWKGNLEFVHLIRESGHSGRGNSRHRERSEIIFWVKEEKEMQQEEKARADYKQPCEFYKDVGVCPGAATITYVSSRGRWGFRGT